MRNPTPAPSLSQLELRDVTDEDVKAVEAVEAVEKKEKRSVRQELRDVNIPAVLSILYICFTLAVMITVGDVFSVQNAQGRVELGHRHFGCLHWHNHARPDAGQSSRTVADQEDAAVRSRGNPHAVRSCCRHVSVFW